MILPTMQLRFVKRRVGRNVVRILQQFWQTDSDDVDHREEWRDVPLAIDFDHFEATKPTSLPKVP